MHVGPGGRTRKGALVRIGLLGAGRVAEMHAQAPRSAGVRDEPITAAPRRSPPRHMGRTTEPACSADRPVFCDALLPPGPTVSFERLDDPYRSILRPDETPV